MKKIIIILIVLLFSITTYAQVYCSYSGGGCANGLVNPTQYVTNVVSDICNRLNIQYINTYAGNVGNACASNYQGMPIITYSSQFMNYLASKNSWAPISVLAHEVGHHINNDISWYGSFKHPWSKELQADYVSGYVLYKMGASLNDATSAFQHMFSWMGTTTHPDTPRRIDALTQGYIRAANGF
nr:hypothetical protein [uncultured Psychroserpens sp.]